MVLSAYDSLIIFMLAFAAMAAIFYFDVMTGNSVSFNSSIDKLSPFENNSLCKDINCTNLEIQFANMRTTTTTIKEINLINITVFNISGNMASVISGKKGNIMVNCGNSTKVMDRLFMSGFSRLGYVFVTEMDEKHAGGCSRTFMMIPHDMIYDTGIATNETWYKDYAFATSDFRYIVSNKYSFKYGIINGIVDRIDDNIVLRFDYLNTSISFIGMCNNSIDYLDSDVVFCDDMISEDLINSTRPYIYVLSNGNSTFSSLGKKYGINVLSPSNFNTLNIIMDGKSVKYSIKK